ncbi:hypothetical protein TNCV_3834211 [Trichonephila clavipes]|nr:hypothetical protein TNCV_3834211 [Trichonephila clavipes]
MTCLGDQFLPPTNLGRINEEMVPTEWLMHIKSVKAHSSYVSVKVRRVVSGASTMVLFSSFESDSKFRDPFPIALL